MAVSRTIFVLSGACVAMLAQLLCAQSPSVREPATPPKVVADGDGAQQFWFGVAVENLPPNIARQLKLKSEQGLMVMGVLPLTPAEKAGLKTDDILIELNGAPLTSQEELARAANSPVTVKLGVDKSLPTPPACDLVYLRDGNRNSITLTAQRRPINMYVGGANMQSFTMSSGNAAGNLTKAGDMKNFVLPNGRGVQIGPGYQIDLQSANASVSWIKEAVKDGETIVLSQETDQAGNTKNTITAGGKKYVLPDDLSSLPANLQPAALQFLTIEDRARKQAPPHEMAATGAAASLDQQLQYQRDQISKLQNQNQHLQEQLDKLQKTLEEKLDKK